MSYPPDKPTTSAPDAAVRSTRDPANLSAASGSGEVVRPYVNDRLNSRIDVSLPDGVWETRWRADLLAGLRPAFVLHAGRRSVVQGHDFWQLFDREGVSVATQRVAASDVVLDPGNTLVYHAAPNGALRAHQLRDGSATFTLGLLFGAEFERVFFARRGQRMIVVSLEQRIDPHEPEVPDYALVEVQDLGDPPQADDLNILTSARLVTSVQRSAHVLHAAMHEETLVLAIPGRVEVLDGALQPLARFEAPFTPLAMSLDEAGRIYLIVRVEDEPGRDRQALWILSPAAEKLVEAAVPVHPNGAYTPPIVGYDHQVYVLLGDRILALSPEGDVLWDEHAGGRIAGAVVTADDQLLAAAGGLLMTFDAQGERTGLFYLDDDHWTTPPVLTAQHRLLVASTQYLYCLQLKP